jgi:hypothetical protein
VHICCSFLLNLVKKYRVCRCRVNVYLIDAKTVTIVYETVVLYVSVHGCMYRTDTTTRKKCGVFEISNH